MSQNPQTSQLQNVIIILEQEPLTGIALGNDFYKIRINIASKGKGKSGGGKIITCVKIIQHTVYPAAIYDKSEKSTLSDAELKLLVKLIG